MASQVFLHIGLPKTGTTYLQSVLWGSKAALAARRLPAAGPRSPRAPVGRPRAAGAAEPRAAPPEGARHPGPAGQGGRTGTRGRPILTHEFMCGAGREQAGRLVESLAPGRGARRDHRPRHPRHAHRRAGRSTSRTAAPSPSAEMRGDRLGRPGRVRLADLGPRRRAPALGPARPARAGARAADARARSAARPALAQPRRGARPRPRPLRRAGRAAQPRARRRPDRAAAPGEPAPRRRSASPSTAAPGSGATSPRATWSTRRVSGSARTTPRWPSAASGPTAPWRIIERRGYQGRGRRGEPPGARRASRSGRARTTVSNAALLASATTLVADMLADVRRIAREARPT